MNCPINEQTGDGATVGRCWFALMDGRTCPRHGDVAAEVQTFEATGKTTLENDMRARKGWRLLGQVTAKHATKLATTTTTADGGK